MVVDYRAHPGYLQELIRTGHPDKQRSRWMVKASSGGAQHYGGRFQSLDDAIAAAEQLRKDLGFRDTREH